MNLVDLLQTSLLRFLPRLFGQAQGLTVAKPRPQNLALRRRSRKNVNTIILIKKSVGIEQLICEDMSAVLQFPRYLLQLFGHC